MQKIDFSSDYTEGCHEAILRRLLETIGARAFGDSPSFSNVYYAGTEENWNAITIDEDNANLASATIHYNYVPQ